MEKMAWVNLLYDFYGQLLTEHQRRLVELYYCQDLSLGEIAEQSQISRQAVHDVIKRAERVLFDCEEKLCLAGRFIEQHRQLDEVLRLLSGDLEKDKDIVNRIKKIIMEVMAH